LKDVDSSVHRDVTEGQTDGRKRYYIPSQQEFFSKGKNKASLDAVEKV
jgi:hypothetical protein